MTEQYQKSIKDTQDNIKQLQMALQGAKQKKDEPRKLDILNSEYDKLAELQLVYSNLLKDNWETHRKEQRAIRKSDIESRQVEFDKELEIQDKERRRKWIPKKVTRKQKIELCNQLLDLLKDEDKLNIVNLDPKLEVDTSLLILPTSFLESFWSLDLEPPVMRSEIDSTVKLLLETKSGLEQ